MSSPWMPLYIGDYLRDTGHLTTLQHGAYLLLIMHYWQHGELPSTSAGKARVVRLSGKAWASNCQALASLFSEDWRHKRIDAELEKQRTINEKRAMAGRKGGLTGRGKNNVDRFVDQANAKHTGGQSHKYITSTEFGTAREEEARRRREESVQAALARRDARSHRH